VSDQATLAALEDKEKKGQRGASVHGPITSHI